VAKDRGHNYSLKTLRDLSLPPTRPNPYLHIIQLGLDLDADGAEDRSLVHTFSSSPGTFDAAPFAIASPVIVHLAHNAHNGNCFVISEPILVRID